jgi:hypothetical protein
MITTHAGARLRHPKKIHRKRLAIPNFLPHPRLMKNFVYETYNTPAKIENDSPQKVVSQGVCR